MFAGVEVKGQRVADSSGGGVGRKGESSLPCEDVMICCMGRSEEHEEEKEEEEEDLMHGESSEENRWPELNLEEYFLILETALGENLYIIRYR